MKNLTVWVGILAVCLMTAARADEGNVLAKQALAKTHNPRAALATLLARLKTRPHDEALRRAVIQVAARVRPAPRIPNDARRHMGHGLAAFGLAKTPQDYLPAIHEFQQASNLAPWWPDPYFNLAKTQELAGDDQSAAINFRNYLAAAPHARDAASVRTELYKVEYLARQKQKATAALAQRQQNAQTILAYLRSHYNGDLSKETFCRGAPIIAGRRVRCTPDQSAGSNWFTGGIYAGHHYKFQYAIVGANSDEIGISRPNAAEFCGTVGSTTALNAITWRQCGTPAKVTVSFDTTNQGIPVMEFDSHCISYPDNPTETDWCAREQFTLAK